MKSDLRISSCGKIRNFVKLNDPGEPDYYFFLNDSLPEDRAIREHLHNCRLQAGRKHNPKFSLTFVKIIFLLLIKVGGPVSGRRSVERL